MKRIKELIKLESNKNNIETSTKLQLQKMKIELDNEKKINELLKANEENLKALFNAMKDDIVLEIDFEGRLLNIAPTSQDNPYKPTNEMLGNTLHEVFSPKNADKLLSAIQQSLNENKIVSVEYQSKVENIDTWFEATISPKTKNTALLIAYDIMDRKKNESELKKLDIAVKQSASIIVITDIDGNIEYVNNKFIETTGYNANEVIGKNPRILNAGNQPKEYYKKMWETILAGKDWKGEFCNKTKSDNLYWEQATITPIKDENDNIINFLGIKEDITLRKKAEEELKVSEEKFRSIFENITDVYYKADKDGKLVLASPSFVSTFGYSCMEDLIGRKISSFYKNPDQRNQFLSLLRKQKKVIGYQAVLLKSNGSEIYVETTANILYDKNGNYAGVDGIVRDITEQKEAEKIIKASGEEYKQLFEENPVSLWNEDFSEVISFLNDLKNKGIINYQEYFENNPEFIIKCANAVKIININQTTLDLLKYKSKSELIDNMTKIFNEKSFETFKEQLVILAQGGKQFSSETEFVCSTGEIISTIVEFKQITDFKKVIFSMTDITERKKTAETLLQFKKIIESTSGHMAFIDTNYIYLEVNKSYTKAHNKKREEIVGHTIAELMGNEVFENVIKEKIDACISGKTVKYEDWFDFAGIGISYMAVSYYPYYDKDNKISGVIVDSHDITERKKAEEELLLREHYLTALNEAKEILIKESSVNPYQQFVDIIGTVSKASRTYIFLNHKNESGELLMSQKAEYCAEGITPEIDNPVLQNLKYDDYAPSWEKLLSKGKIISGSIKNFPKIEKEFLDAQGIKAILSIPIMNEGEFIGFIGFDNCYSEDEWKSSEQTFLQLAANNLSQFIQRQRTRLQLQSEFNRFQTTMDALDAVVYVADIKTYELLFSNKKFNDLFGKHFGEKCYSLIQKGQTKPCEFCTNHLLLDEKGIPKEPYIWEFQNTKTLQWYQCRDQAIRWTDGRFVRMEIAVDITDRKQAELCAKKEFDRYKSIMDINPSGIYIVDKDYNIQYVNPVIKKDFGEIKGQKCYSYLHGFSEVCSFCKNKEVFAGNVVKWEWSSDKTNKVYELFDAPITNPDGSVSKFEMFYDITKRKNNEKKLKEYAKTQKILFREVNHRVKNNLSALISLIRKGQDNAEIKGFTHLEIFDDLIGRIYGLAAVHSLLSNSEWQPLQLNHLCQEIINGRLNNSPLKKDIEVDIDRNSKILISSSQSHQLALVINELTTNSLKYSMINRDTGKITVKIEQNNKQTSLTYSDDGHGFPQEILDGNKKNYGIGFDLIFGIVTHSLAGNVKIENQNGAKTIITFNNELLDKNWLENEDI